MPDYCGNVDFEGRKGKLLLEDIRKECKDCLESCRFGWEVALSCKFLESGPHKSKAEL